MAEEGVFSQCCGVSSTIAAQPNIQTILRGGKRFEFVWLKQVQIKTLGAEGSASAPLERDSRRLSRWFREEERMGYPPPPDFGAPTTSLPGCKGTPGRTLGSGLRKARRNSAGLGGKPATSVNQRGLAVDMAVAINLPMRKPLVIMACRRCRNLGFSGASPGWYLQIGPQEAC